MVARIQVPPQAREGEVIEVRVSVQHAMESGFRYDNMGRSIPRNIIHTLTCRYGGREVFRADMGSGIAANPYIQFCIVAKAAGDLMFDWTDDAGHRGSERIRLNVVA
jgi:sulfur-oxidizing protein SoxZ